jgi:vacuolar-type H+-ATPase subunit I/STV1
MSSTVKATTLRALMPQNQSQSTASLSQLGRVDTWEVILSTGGLTTESVVQQIKVYTKLRDEIVQVLRQLGIGRTPQAAKTDIATLKNVYSDVESQTAEARAEYQQVTSELSMVEKQILEADKQIATVEQLKTTGFSNDEMLSAATGFRRILGRLPSKKLDAAQRAVRTLLKERTVMTTGAKRNDWVYLLVATPTENASQALQTLLLYDFILTDMPSFDGPDLGQALKSWQTKKDLLTKEKQSLESRLEALRERLDRPLNQSADNIEEALLLLRGSLRLGEGTNAIHVFARLDKPVTNVTLNLLQKDGVLELE